MREIPPTAGLPLQWRDFLPSGKTLEQGVATFLDLPEVQIECSGTAALVVALTALKQGSTRTSVVIPAYTCPLVPIAIVHCGLKPVLCDIQPNHFDLCPHSLAQVCNQDTLAIIPTHLGGRVADLAPVLETARHIGAYVVEDAAQALGAQWNGQSVGLAGDVGFFSLAVGKGLSIFEGGVLIARDPALRRRLREISASIIPPSLYWETRRLIELTGYAAFYNPFGLRYVYGNPLRSAIKRGWLIEAVGDDFDFDIPLHRVGSFRKVIGANALSRLPEFLRQTETQATGRKEQIKAVSGLRVLEDMPGGQGTWPYFMVMMPDRQTRDAALQQLWGAGLGVSRLFIHALPDYDYLHHLFRDASIPNARDFAARMLTISNSPWLQQDEFNLSCSILADHRAAQTP